MASSTVIDSLIVKLGLDPKDFTKGEKLAAAQTVQLENQVKKSSDNMGRSFLGFTTKLTGVATAIAAVKKTIDFTSELSTTIRQLGIDAGNYGIAASQLRNFGNIAEMNGGKAQDATKTIAGLNKAVYDLSYNGTISDSLIMLGRLGVHFQDAGGNARDFQSVVLDTQNAIQASMRSGTSHANAYQMLLQAGFDPGLANAMLQGNVGAQLQQQKQHRQVSAADVATATDWEKSAANRSQAIDAAGVKLVNAAAPLATATNNKIAAGIDATGNADFASLLSTAGSAIARTFNGAGTAATNLAHNLADLGDRVHSEVFPKGRAAYESTISAASKKFGLPGDMLAGVLNTESGFNPSAVNAKSGATGIAQLMPKYFPGAGKDPNADIFTSAEYIRKLHDAFVSKGEADDQGAWTLALQGYNAGQTRVERSLQPGGKPLAQETADYPGKVLGYASQATPTPGAQGGVANSPTNITFEEVNVNSNASNGRGFAADFVESTRRKYNAALADRGMQ